MKLMSLQIERFTDDGWTDEVGQNIGDPDGFRKADKDKEGAGLQ